jgi:hypothetical protein
MPTCSSRSNTDWIGAVPGTGSLAHRFKPARDGHGQLNELDQRLSRAKVDVNRAAARNVEILDDDAASFFASRTRFAYIIDAQANMVETVAAALVPLSVYRDRAVVLSDQLDGSRSLARVGSRSKAPPLFA